MSAVLISGAVLAAVVGPAASLAASKPKTSPRVSVDVNAGGPYRVSVGESISLAGSFTIAGQAKTTADLRRIGEALKRYHDAHGSFPPAALADASGKPMLSWRVLLLPYLGEQALYDRFDLTQPWDSPANRALLSRMPVAFRSATQRGSSTNTAYAGVAGAKQLFRGSAQTLGGGVKLLDVSDGADMTIAVGPVGSGLTLPWSAPGDLDLRGPTSLGTPNGFDGAGASVTPMLFLDGAVRTIPDDTPADIIESWSTLGGGGCTPPTSVELKLQPFWDLDGDGQYETPGLSPTFTATRSGSRSLKVRVIDAFGGVHTSSARVNVR